MTQPILAASLSIALTVASSTAGAAECDHERDLTLGLNAVGANSLRVEAGAGSLDIVGVDGAEAITARGVACADDRDLLDAMALVDDSSGSELVLRTEIPEHGGGWWGEGSPYIDLVIEVPTRLMLDVSDGSGRMAIRHVGALSVRDGSGEMAIEDVAGDLRVRDGSGSLEISLVRGNVWVVDGSGSLDIRDIEGAVTIEEDGSGSMEIAHVTEGVTIERDGSGSIDVADVSGDVHIGSDGSGGIVVREVAGNFEVRRDGSGGVRYSGVRGRVDVPSEYR